MPAATQTPADRARTKSARRVSRAAASRPLTAEPLWYKDAVIYELHVRAFHDSNGDGIGDFPGLTQKLDYLESLGITAIWILPFYPSPLRDDGYDIADYTAVNPSYGTMKDFKSFIDAAHDRGIRVITELVINHTSDQHPWFQKARRSPPGARAREMYVWSDTPEKYQDARIIFKDYEPSNWSWDPVARQYYWHRFFSHQPDLNFENPAVHEAVTKALDFWMDLGVDGMRLDAIPYLYEEEGTNCENLPKTHEFLKKLRAHLDRKYPGRMFLAEANQWPEDAIAYFGDGDECHMSFHFPLMPRMFMALRMEDRYPIIDIMEQTPPIPANCQWAIFLRNHDELTLEMVTDEERDYMYRSYAHDRKARINLGIRRRLAPLLDNDRKKIELMNGLLFSLPGSPVLYYGDEIGMGDNHFLGDRDGVRTPMQWNGDRNAGFSRANPQKLYLPVIIDPQHHYETVNVESQQENVSSLLWWMRRLIALRKGYPAFARGSLTFLQPDNGKVLAYIRELDLGDGEVQRLLVVANLSRYSQPCELDLSHLAGTTPVEMFGAIRFPKIGELPYFLTLGPHQFNWFLLEPGEQHAHADARVRQPDRRVEFPGEDHETWPLSPQGRRWLERRYRALLPAKRWFAGKARTVRSVRIADALRLPERDPALRVRAYILLLSVDYTEGDEDRYQVAVAVVPPERVAMTDDSPGVLAELVDPDTDARRLVVEGALEAETPKMLLETLVRRRRPRGLAGERGELEPSPTPALPELIGDHRELEPALGSAEQSNTSIVFGRPETGNRAILKLFRRLDAGRNPDAEVLAHLTRVGFRHIPRLGGSLEYRQNGDVLTLAVLQEFVPNEGDAWRHTLDHVARFLDRVVPKAAEGDPPKTPGGHLLARARLELPEELGDYLHHPYEEAKLLGRRTCEMHLALADDRGDPDFAPEPFSQLYQRSLYQSLQSRAKRTLKLLRRQEPRLEEHLRPEAREVLDASEALLERLRRVTRKKLEALRIRCHGDYHLGQVLWTGRDFVIIDFEGEPARPLSERRLKRSPMSDVAGMLRSYHYAAFTGLSDAASRGLVVPAAVERDRLEAWAALWQGWVSAGFLRGYLGAARGAGAPFVPPDENDLGLMLDAWQLDKALYEIAYELNNRPAWVGIPLRGVLDILHADPEPPTT